MKALNSFEMLTISFLIVMHLEMYVEPIVIMGERYKPISVYLNTSKERFVT